MTNSRQGAALTANTHVMGAGVCLDAPTHPGAGLSAHCWMAVASTSRQRLQSASLNFPCGPLGRGGFWRAA